MRLPSMLCIKVGAGVRPCGISSCLLSSVWPHRSGVGHPLCATHFHSLFNPNLYVVQGAADTLTRAFLFTSGFWRFTTLWISFGPASHDTPRSDMTVTRTYTQEELDEFLSVPVAQEEPAEIVAIHEAQAQEEAAALEEAVAVALVQAARPQVRR